MRLRNVVVEVEFMLKGGKDQLDDFEVLNALKLAIARREFIELRKVETICDRGGEKAK